MIRPTVPHILAARLDAGRAMLRARACGHAGVTGATRRRIMLWLLVGVGAVVLLRWLVAVLLLLNASWSAPHWGYARIPIALWPFDITRGDWIQFTPPGVTPPDVTPPDATPAAEAPWPYIKQVRGLPGDMVSVSTAREVTVGGRPVGVAKTHALSGRPVAAVAPGIVPAGHYFVTAPHPDSHDSRYAEIGPVPHGAVLARVWPLPDIPFLGLEGPLMTPERLKAESGAGESGNGKADMKETGDE